MKKINWFAMIFLAILCTIIVYAYTAIADDEFQKVTILDVEKIKICYDIKILSLIPSKECKIVLTEELIAWVDENGEIPKFRVPYILSKPSD